MKIMAVNNNNTHSRTQKQQAFGMRFTNEIETGLKGLGAKIFNNNKQNCDLFISGLNSPKFKAFIESIATKDESKALTVSGMRFNFCNQTINISYTHPNLQGLEMISKNKTNFKKMLSSPGQLIHDFMNIFYNDAQKISINDKDTADMECIFHKAKINISRNILKPTPPIKQEEPTSYIFHNLSATKIAEIETRMNDAETEFSLSTIG